MTTEFVDVDVRPILRAGGEPFSVIMQAVEGLEPGQGMRLLATFKIAVWCAWDREASVMKPSNWMAGNGKSAFVPKPPCPRPRSIRIAPMLFAWPEPLIDLDNRDLDPPPSQWPGCWRRPNA